ncbi:hypothetical protein [Nocardia testacea]|uniref:DUF7426 family protein n=1 Tax=Nocardia testacea TaxID=248551 RepID=UPI003A852ACF
MTDRLRATQDYDEFADPDLYLPVRGRRVRIPSPTAREGLRLRRLFVDLDALTPDVERVEVRRILGDAWEALDALGADANVIALAGRTALLHYGKGAAAAAAYWNGELAPDASPEPERSADPSAPGYLGPDDPGGGPIDPVSGLRLWFNPTEMAPSQTTAPTMPWRDIVACWLAIELDLHTVYGVDVDSGVLDQRPWRWLEVRIRDLMTRPGTRLHRAVFPPTK